MSADVVKERITETSPQVCARIGESSLCLWLMVKGVNVPKWNEKARLALG
jgi:hypothetical protein